MLDPQVALRAALGNALDDMGLTYDEDWIEDFLRALKAHGYIMIREVNGVHPDARKE